MTPDSRSGHQGREKYDFRNAHLPAEARHRAARRAGLRRQDRRAGQALAARRLLAHRGRHAEPDHPYLAVQGHQRAQRHSRQGRRDEGLAAGDLRFRPRDGEQDPLSGALLAELPPGEHGSLLRVPHLHLRRRRDPQGDGYLEQAHRRAHQDLAADLRRLYRDRPAQSVDPCLGLQEHGRARAAARDGHEAGQWPPPRPEGGALHRRSAPSRCQRRSRRSNRTNRRKR